ncbi:CHASE2 domain-containing protein [Fibrobacter sp. UBA4309]|uniref:CHASE2 domain-containing protein n=1 Tax=Fibrobacter sp. UBA4309 TaxID=1946537 RepID=UPI0025C1F511|nr:CHASE2 domain-containing protein [Fibrobacter sp. UBA4309]
MQKKVSKKIKKFSVGVSISAMLVFIILFFGNVQDPNLYFAKSGAESLEYLFYDLFFKTRTGKITDTNKDNSVVAADNYDPNILIVDIDEPSLTKLGPYTTWERDFHADVTKNLTEGGASAIGFDIMFKTADFGKKKTDNNMVLINKLKEQNALILVNDSAVMEGTHSFFNYDSMLVTAIKESGNTIMCYDFGEWGNYKHESQWRPISSLDWAKDIGFGSTFTQSQIDHPENIENKDLLDNIFPEIAHASKFIGSVNAYPDEDGVVRRVAMLYRFPNKELNDSLQESDVRIYTTMSLMTVLHLYRQKPENVIIKMGKYIDVGKPFGVYRDDNGEIQTTFPRFTYPMFTSLQKKLKAAAEKIRNTSKSKRKAEFIDVSSKIIASKDEDGSISFDIFEGQTISDRFSTIVQTMDTTIFGKLEGHEEKEIEENITIKRDSLDDNHFVITDTEEEDEVIVTPFVVSTIQSYADSLKDLEPGRLLHLAMDMDIRYDYNKKAWKSNMVILSSDVLQDILNTPESAIENLKKGEELRFGNVKRIPIDKYGRYLVNYQGRYNTIDAQRSFQHLSYYDVLKHRVDPGFYQGKTFILGSAAAAMFDFVSGPHEEHYPGVLVHSTILQNILNNQFIVFLQEHYQQIIVLILAILCTFVGLYIRSYIAISFALIMMFAYTIVAYFYFVNGTYIGVSKQLLTILLTTISALIVQFYFESKEKNFLNNAFKQYISPELIDAMVTNEIMPTLGGSKSNITAYFTDIASFSTFSEKIGDPSKLVDLLNEYLTAMTDTLLGNKGTLDKYEGDAIIAFFGAPMPLENHAQSACNSAIDMQNKLKKLRKKWKGEGDKWPEVVHNMHMRIGINSGDIVTGNMGSSMRKNYTMMGDAVNLAARLESAAKQYGAYIQISEDTQSHLEDGKYIYRSLDTIRVVGKSKPVKTFELLERSGCDNEAQLKKLVEIWEQGRSAYLNMEWDKAKELFTQCLEYEPHLPEHDPGSKTCPSLVYIQRCENYKINPPVPAGETWDGVFTATSK